MSQARRQPRRAVASPSHCDESVCGRRNSTSSTSRFDAAVLPQRRRGMDATIVLHYDEGNVKHTTRLSLPRSKLGLPLSKLAKSFAKSLSTKLGSPIDRGRLVFQTDGVAHAHDRPVADVVSANEDATLIRVRLKAAAAPSPKTSPERAPASSQQRLCCQWHRDKQISFSKYVTSRFESILVYTTSLKNVLIFGADADLM